MAQFAFELFIVILGKGTIKHFITASTTRTADWGSADLCVMADEHAIVALEDLRAGRIFALLYSKRNILIH